MTHRKNPLATMSSIQATFDPIFFCSCRTLGLGSACDAVGWAGGLKLRMPAVSRYQHEYCRMIEHKIISSTNKAGSVKPVDTCCSEKRNETATRVAGPSLRRLSHNSRKTKHAHADNDRKCTDNVSGYSSTASGRQQIATYRTQQTPLSLYHRFGSTSLFPRSTAGARAHVLLPIFAGSKAFLIGSRDVWEGAQGAAASWWRQPVYPEPAQAEFADQAYLGADWPENSQSFCERSPSPLP